MTDMDSDSVVLPDPAGHATTPAHRTASRAIALVRRMPEMERVIVARIAGPARAGWLRDCAIYLNKLGNGWLYAPLALLIVLSGDPRRWRVLLAAVLAVGCAHVLYPLIKNGIRRVRPFEADPSLRSLAQPLDRYSFPSGHCMTFAAVLFPVSLAWPGMFAGLLALWALIAWASLASAHHYVSDVIAGTTLGIVVAWPICGALLD